MDIEILKDILDLAEDKQNTIVYFLNPDIQKKLLNYYYYDKNESDIYVDQHIILVKKNDLTLEEKDVKELKSIIHSQQEVIKKLSHQVKMKTEENSKLKIMINRLR